MCCPCSGKYINSQLDTLIVSEHEERYGRGENMPSLPLVTLVASMVSAMLISVDVDEFVYMHKNSVNAFEGTSQVQPDGSRCVRKLSGLILEVVWNPKLHPVGKIQRPLMSKQAALAS
jgi:hypothetical protein